MELPKRKPNRLFHYDYSSEGAYFVTICTQERRPILCSIVGDGFPVPKTPGTIAESCIKQIPNKYHNVMIDHYVIMPNHIHMIVFIQHRGTGDPSPTLGEIIAWYKYAATKQINAEGGTPGTRVFQRSFHDHIIRGEQDYAKIWEYITHNPARWVEDCFYCE